MAAAEKRIQAIKDKLAVMEGAQTEMNAGDIGKTAKRFEESKEVLEQWEGFFALESDELPA